MLPSTAPGATSATATLVGFGIAPSRRFGTASESDGGTPSTTSALSGLNGSRGTNSSNSGSSCPYPGFDSFEPIPLSKNAVRHHHQHQQQHQHQQTQTQTQQKQQQQQQLLHNGITHHHPKPPATSAGASEVATALVSFPKQQQRSLHHGRHVAQLLLSEHATASAALSDLFLPPSIGRPSDPDESWLDELQLTVSGLSLEPLSGKEVVRRLHDRTDEVLSRYLPCVDFLVQCQQDLRKGLTAATAKRFVHHMFRDAMTPRQFFNTYIADLPERFYRKNRRSMNAENLDEAVRELQKLCANARAAESQGCEVVKNTFLGGMKDGESWGLRKWLSKQGGALSICNDTECILNSCQKLDRSSEATGKLAARLRPMARLALDKLKAEVPSSYQEQSSAHPYLPFFHRLESALRGMSNFDPEDDDVICIDDDDEVEELKAQAARPVSQKTKAAVTERGGGGSSNGGSSLKRKAAAISKSSDDEDGNDEDSDSDLELLDGKPAAKLSSKPSSKSTDDSVNGLMTALTGTGDDSDYMKALLRTFEDDADDDVIIDFDALEQKTNLFANNRDANDLAAAVDQLATLFESNQHDLLRPNDLDSWDDFWDDPGRYASALRLFSDVLRAPDTTFLFLERVDEDELVQEGKLPYGSIIKHPLCIRDIVAALVADYNVDNSSVVGNNGTLPVASLSSWNMWHGSELLQAIDLVFLNALAYGKANDGSSKSNERSRTNRLRKELWAGIKDVIDNHVASSDAEARRRNTPTRRGESSGFVVHKGAI